MTEGKAREVKVVLLGDTGNLLNYFFLVRERNLSTD